MNEIELVIKIPKELYNACDGAKNVVGDGSMYDLLIDAVGNGAPLDNIFNKIRAEIEEEMLIHSGTGEEVIQAYVDGLKKGLDIIDKCKVESEEEE